MARVQRSTQPGARRRSGPGRPPLRNYSGDRSRWVGRGGAAAKRAQARFGKKGCTCSTKKSSGEPRLRHRGDCLLALALSRAGTSFAVPTSSKQKRSSGATRTLSTPSSGTPRSIGSSRRSKSNRRSKTAQTPRSSGAATSSTAAPSSSSSAQRKMSSGAAASSGASTSSRPATSPAQSAAAQNPPAPSSSTQTSGTCGSSGSSQPSTSSRATNSAPSQKSASRNLLARKIRDFFEVIFMRTPWPTSDVCNVQDQKFRLKKETTTCYFKNRRYRAMDSFLSKKDAKQLPKEMRALFGFYNQLGKKLASREQAVEVARAAKTNPLDVERSFALFRRQERLYGRGVEVPEESLCPNFYSFRNEWARKVPDGAGVIEHDPEYSDAVLAVKEADAIAWHRSQHPSKHPEDPVGGPEIEELTDPLEPVDEDLQPRQVNVTPLQSQASRAGFSLILETPLPFDNSFDWREWTNQQILEFGSQFLSDQAVRDLRDAAAIGAELEQFRSRSQDLLDGSNFTLEEIRKIQRYLDEMDQYKASLQRRS